MKCFVISPIGDEGSSTRAHADEVFTYIIEPALKVFGIDPIRSDHMAEPGKISDQMYRAIFEYDLCIAVLTFSNPNVYYELAVAQSACRPVILLIEKGNNLPFDVKDTRVVEYDLSITSYKNQTHVNRLVKFLEQLKNVGWKGEDVFRHYRELKDPARALDVESFGIKILSPSTGDAVDVVTVHGTYQRLPDGFELRSLRYYPDQNGYVPTGSVVIDTLKKTWKVFKFDIGGKSGDSRGIEIALAGPDARGFLDYCLEANSVHREAMEEIRSLKGEYGKWLPIIRRWPLDLIPCDRIEVMRK